MGGGANTHRVPIYDEMTHRFSNVRLRDSHLVGRPCVFQTNDRRWGISRKSLVLRFSETTMGTVADAQSCRSQTPVRMNRYFIRKSLTPAQPMRV